MTGIITHCPKCGSQLVNAVQYAVCPNGDSRLMPKVPKPRKKRPPRPHEYAHLPEATSTGALPHVRVTPGQKRRWRECFEITGRDGYWIRPLFHRPDDERIACRVGNCRVVLVKFNEETMQ